MPYVFNPPRRCAVHGELLVSGRCLRCDPIRPGEKLPGPSPANLGWTVGLSILAGAVIWAWLKGHL